MSIDDIAKQLKNLADNIILIYAFNATGKTRLSVAYKNETKNSDSGQHAGVYYNAFSEDLFVWDNDEENDGANIKLNVLPSSLNRFHSFLYEDPDVVMDKLAMYSPKFNFRLNTYTDLESGIKSVSFFARDSDNDVPIKISRGEERIFVWCFFLALLEVDGWSNTQDEHIFIDDPVSSLDEHNIYVTADTIFQQVEQHYLEKKIIVTTHHIGLFSILANRLKKGGKSDKYKNLTKLFVLKNNDEKYTLSTPRNSVFLFHLHILQILDKAKEEQLYTHHVVMLRQALENISSFFGRGNIGYTLSQIGIEDHENAANIINSLSHKDAYYYQSNLMPTEVEKVFRDVFDKLLEKYKFALG